MTSFRSILSFASVMALTLTAFADTSFSACPVPGDLKNGITVTRNNPFYSSLFEKKDTVIHEKRIMSRDGKPEHVSSTSFHPLTVYERISDKGTLTAKYDSDLSDLDSLPDRKSWVSNVSYYNDNKLIGKGTLTIIFKGAKTYTVGNCSYPVWSIETKSTINDKIFVGFKKKYSPDLEMVLMAVKLNSSGKALSSVIYDEISSN